MTFWQENYQFTKEVYDMRYTKFAEWMETLEKSIARIMADRVYSSGEFKRERDNFYVSFEKKYLFFSTCEKKLAIQSLTTLDKSTFILKLVYIILLHTYVN